MLIRFSKILTLSLCSLIGQSDAKNLDFSTTLQTTGYLYETKTGDNETLSNEAIVFAPSVLASYSNRRFSASLIADHTKVEQNKELDSADKNFTEFKYNSNLTLIDNSLFLIVNGARNYRPIAQQQGLVSDKILGAVDLTAFRTTSASLNFVVPNPKHIGLNIQSNYSETKTDESLNGLGGVNGDNLSVSATLYQGNSAHNYRYNLSGQFNDTSRTTFQDFKSTALRGTIGFAIAPNYELVLVGSSEDYDVGPQGLSLRTNLDTTSYGAGIEWSPMSDRSITMTYNQLDEGENQTDFVGVNIDWAFSTRTEIVFDYGKRFYGDAYSLNFSHALKYVRSSIVYSEDVTSFSRLVTGATNIVGLFVCQFGATELSECFQPEDTDYQLQAGEEFRTLSEIETDINEEVLFRKSGAFNLSYDKRWIKVSLNASYSKTEYLESNRVQTNLSVRGNFAYELGRKSELNFSATFSKNKIDEEFEPDTIASIGLDFKRDISRNLKLTLGTRLLDRESDDIRRNLTDKRLSVGVSYVF